MRQGIHPEYGPVAFRDSSTGKVFLTRSTLVSRRSARTVVIDGVTYPVVDADVTADSHPFWTGKKTVIDSEGRIEAFRRRYGGRS